MTHRATVTVDWLRKGKSLDDPTILRNIILDTMDRDVEKAVKSLERKKSKKHLVQSLANWLNNQKLDSSLFEHQYGLAALPDDALPLTNIGDALHYYAVHEEIPGREAPLIPGEGNLSKQMRALLPSCIAKAKSVKSQESDDADPRRDALVYTLARISEGWTPNPKDWPLMPIGLDILTASLLTIHMVGEVTGVRIPWLATIWKYETERYRYELLRDLLRDLVPDATVGEAQDLLTKFQNNLKEDLPRDPILGWVFEWQERLRAYPSGKRLIECGVAEQKEPGRSSSDETASKSEEEKTPESAKGRPKHFRTRLRQEILQHIEPSASGIETPQTPQPRSLWSHTTLRADGPFAYQSEGLLSSLRAEMNVLQFDQVIKTCQYLADVERPGRPISADISRATGVGPRSAHVERVELALRERYILSLMDIGLRQRYIFTDMQKSSIASNGMVERMVISGASQFNAVASYLEPSTSSGPKEEDLPEEYYQTAVESDLISMRLDLFNKNSNSWRIEPWDESSPPGRTPLWLMRETSSQVKESIMPTQREVDIISIISATSTNATQRRWLLDAVQFPFRTADHLLTQLLKKNVTRLLYHPTLEFSGLPEGIIVASKFKTERDLDEFIEWLTISFPYVQIQFSRKEKSAVSRVRVPRFTTTEGMIRERLKKSKAERALGTIARNRTYLMSALHRIYQAKSSPWLDPWESS